MRTTVTDLAPDAIRRAGAGPRRASMRAAWSAASCPRSSRRDDFFRLTEARIRRHEQAIAPERCATMTFCWSICALEHLGSIENGLSFIENSLDTLKPGGVAIHTTEFNFYDDGRTIDNWACVYFQKATFPRTGPKRLRQKGYEVPAIDFRSRRRPDGSGSSTCRPMRIRSRDRMRSLMGDGGASQAGQRRLRLDMLRADRTQARVNSQTFEDAS